MKSKSRGIRVNSGLGLSALLKSGEIDAYVGRLSNFN